jgi:hypothetical protein
MKSLLLTLAAAPLFLAAPARAQWQDVSYTFKSGWNGNDITEPLTLSRIEFRRLRGFI